MRKTESKILADEKGMKKHICSPMERLSGLAWTKYSFSPVARNFLNVVLRISVTGFTAILIIIFYCFERNESVGSDPIIMQMTPCSRTTGKGNEPVGRNPRMEI